MVLALEILNLSATAIQQSTQTAKELVVADAQFKLQQDNDVEQRKLITSQITLTNTENSKLTSDKNLVDKQISKVTEEIKNVVQDRATGLMINARQANLIYAQILESVRRSGTSVATTQRTITDTSGGLSFDFSDMTFTVAEATDMTKGLMGLQMKLADAQATSFASHSSIQGANSIAQVAGMALADGITTIDGLLAYQRKLIENGTKINADSTLTV